MKFIEDVHHALGRYVIEQNNPEFTVLKRVDGGWMLFESYDEYRTWKAQK